MPIDSLVVVLPADGRLIVDKTGLGEKRFDFDLVSDRYRITADAILFWLHGFSVGCG